MDWRLGLQGPRVPLASPMVFHSSPFGGTREKGLCRFIQVMLISRCYGRELSFWAWPEESAEWERYLALHRRQEKIEVFNQAFFAFTLNTGCSHAVVKRCKTTAVTCTKKKKKKSQSPNLGFNAVLQTTWQAQGSDNGNSFSFEVPNEHVRLAASMDPVLPKLEYAKRGHDLSERFPLFVKPLCTLLTAEPYRGSGAAVCSSSCPAGPWFVGLA